MQARDPFNGPEEAGVPLDALAFIVMKARAYDAEVETDDPDSGSNPADDREIDALEMSADNPTAAELRSAIGGLNRDQRASLVALAWIGRGDFEPQEWPAAVAEAAAGAAARASRYLMGLPLLGDLLEEGAGRLGFSLTRDEQVLLHHPATERPSEEDRY
jgi:hypothetical protein